MSCSEGDSGGFERYPGTGCCGTSCAAEQPGCLASAPRIRSCFCQENVGCLDRADCGGFRPRGTAATGACPGPCQCAEEEAWNRNSPPKPNCEWLSNFSELRRQWSDHGRQNNCKCCNCKPCRTAAPCKPCLPAFPKCSPDSQYSDYCQTCCDERLSGGASGKTSSRQRGSSPSSMVRSSGGGCSPPSCNRSSPSKCCAPSTNPCSSVCESPSQLELSSCRPTSSCQPCSPSQRPTLKKRSCCQCIPGQCMCQPMPRNCNCPPPIQVDAKAERECECECPSSPECACPPSERKFARTKVKCPNARMCCSTPRPQPGPKCCCTKCQPCLPPPCDPCTSSKCRTVTPKVQPCRGDSSCDDHSPCRPETPKLSPCRPTPPCDDCRKMAPSCRPPLQPTSFHQAPRQSCTLNQSQPRCPVTWGSHRSDKDCGDDNGDADMGCQEVQCHCGSSGSRGCADSCDHCCSVNCNSDCPADAPKCVDIQCGCGAGTKNEDISCHDNCNYCCSVNCDSETLNYPKKKKKNKRGLGMEKRVRMAAGATNYPNVVEVDYSQEKIDTEAWPTNDVKAETSNKNHSTEKSLDDKLAKSSSEIVTLKSGRNNSNSIIKTKFRLSNDSMHVTARQDSKVSQCNSLFPTAPVLSAVAESPKFPCTLLRSLIRAKSAVKHYK